MFMQMSFFCQNLIRDAHCSCSRKTANNQFVSFENVCQLNETESLLVVY